MNKKQCGTVKMNSWVPLLGVIFLTVFSVFWGMAVHQRAGVPVYAGFGAFCLMSLLMILTVNQRIEFTPEGFVYRDLFRIKHRYHYSQVKKIRYGKDVTIIVGHRIILIDALAENGRKFARIAGQYSKAPFITDQQSKLFGGNVESPGEFVFIDVMLAAVIIGAAAWTLYEFRAIRLEELTLETHAVADYSFGDTEEYANRLSIRFSGSEQTFYSWFLDKNSEQYAGFQDFAANGMTFDVYYAADEDVSDSGVKIYQLCCGDDMLISLDDINGHTRGLRNTLLTACAALFGLWLLFVIVSSYVMTNADRYPRLVKLFVKPEYLVKKR